MPSSRQIDLSENQILAGLTEEESKRLRPHLQFVTLQREEVLWGAGDSIRYVHFPQGAVASLIVSLADGRSVEAALVGDEGLLGIRAIVGWKTQENPAIVAVPGRSLRIRTEALRAEFQRAGLLHDRVLRYTGYLLAQISQTAACNRVHRLEERLARWLLMVCHRTERHEFLITHEFLSQILGTPRSEVSLAAGILRESGLIRYARGKITILDRKRLESAACECHKIDADGWHPRHNGTSPRSV